MIKIIGAEKTMFSFASIKKFTLIFSPKAYWLFLLTISTTLVQAQVSRFSGWGALINTVKLNKSVNIIFDAQIRSSDLWNSIETTIIRPGLSFSTNNRSSFSLGLALVSNQKTVSGVKDYVADNRAWQQWQTSHRLRVNLLQHRFRLEERSIPTVYAEGNELKTKNGKFNTRLRYFNRYASGFTKGVKVKEGPYWVLSNEFFFNAIGANHANGKLFDQSRTFAGTGYRITSVMDVELGYMLQHIEGKGKGYTNNHILQLSSFLRL